MAVMTRCSNQRISAQTFKINLIFDNTRKSRRPHQEKTPKHYSRSHVYFKNAKSVESKAV